MTKKNEKPSELKTIGREAKQKAEGYGYVIAGGIFLVGSLLLGFSSKSFVLGLFPFAIAIVMYFIGTYKLKKTQHITWNMEAIEQEQYLETKESKCNFCGKFIEERAAFCSYCGKPLKPICHNCGLPNDKNAEFCSKCGTQLT